ncbi:MAG TPA: glycosyltransferase [Roseimicrobium sp.]|nr:glycosyltransferase [Roseimicrobium sp.]
MRTDPRFRPGPSALPDDGVFRIVYTGSLTVMKGIPVLIDAFQQLGLKESELRLIGGWSTRGMRKYMREAMAKDQRIHLSPGDPLPHLQRANAYVHPTWEDGWAYAAAEAVACGVPTIVTADTGMKEIIADGKTGYVVPTGDAAAIAERLWQIRNGAFSNTKWTC